MFGHKGSRMELSAELSCQPACLSLDREFTRCGAMIHQGQLTGHVVLSKRISVHTVLVNKWRLFNKLQEESPALKPVVSVLWGLKKMGAKWQNKLWVAYQKGYSNLPTLSDRKFTSNVEEAALSEVRKMSFSPGKTAHTRK